MSKGGVTRALWGAGFVLAAGAAAMFAYRTLRTGAEADVYRERLSVLADDYETLRARYNEAVARTAVTELVVKDGRLKVRIRNTSGVVKELETPFDPAGEVYVDYVVLDGRLWIRRLFDEHTPPGRGLLIDPELTDIDWQSPAAAYGNAVYRRLSEGRWIITVTGDGALGLKRIGPDEPTDLTRAPAVREYESIEDDAKARAQSISAADLWRRLIGAD